MSVSRETLTLTKKVLGSVFKGGSSFSINLFGEPGLLSFFLAHCGGGCLLVKDEDFWSVFNSLYRANIPSFSVISNFKPTSPLGFVSPLKRAQLNYLLYKDNPCRVVLVNKSCYDGSYDYYCEGKVFRIDGGVEYDELVDAVKFAGMVRAPTVSVPGTYSKRGGVVDFFPTDSQYPVRVDFSFDRARLFRFNVSSQLTLSSLVGFSFILSSSSFKRVGTKKMLEGLPLLTWSGGFLGSGSEKNVINLSLCKYDSYKDIKIASCVSSYLHSTGFFLNGALFVPPWFLGNQIKKKPAATAAFQPFDGLAVGDFLVHEEFGVCSFDGLVEGCDDDESCVLVRFSDGKISVPVSKMFLLSRYAGVKDELLLNKISKKGLWKRKIKSISRGVDVFVQSLLDQHLQRVKTSVDREPIDLRLLGQFVAAFKYKDTPDQTAVYKEILCDLTSPAPMDRLLCGDVGFGKTEIAIRAAFISILSGGRVLVLAPTTILCYQLYESFSSRLNPFAVNVGMVSRLSAQRPVDALVDDFSSGKIDVLVCTHKIFNVLSKIKKIDLLVVDEEHRFGVKQKEGFLTNHPGLDVLLMSATPIPRSLQSALSGIKTISTISTPPINRRPIQTVVDFYDLDTIFQYINYEVSRGGQVYFLHNNIQTLDKIKRLVLDGCRDVEVKIIHGKMRPEKIEGTINSFSQGGFHVLVSTTIIENGLDIPNVNTIIINNAHLFGLSQLHQIRGRVGRHSRQAFAYLLVPKSLKLNGEAKQRLKAVEKNVSLGSGYNISTKDLEIRGGGSVFGYNQSGGAAIGFDLYNKILNRALSNRLQGTFSSIDDISINIYSGEAFFPTSYIEDDGLRMSLYKNLLSIGSRGALFDFQKNLENRFGGFPRTVENLLLSQGLKISCFDVGVSSVSVDSLSIYIVFLPNEKNESVHLFVDWFYSFLNKAGVEFTFKPVSENRLVLSINNIIKKKDIYVFLKDLLDKFRDTFLRKA